MDFDDDAPPELVDIAGLAEENEDITVKVPITIVTGEIVHPTAGTNTQIYLTACRLPRSWKDNPSKLHPHRSTWQENCRDYEWYDANRR